MIWIIYLLVIAVKVLAYITIGSDRNTHGFIRNLDHPNSWLSTCRVHIASATISLLWSLISGIYTRLGLMLQWCTNRDKTINLEIFAALVSIM